MAIATPADRSFAAEGSSVASHLPKQTCFVATTGNLKSTCEAFARTPLGKSLTGPSFGPLRAALDKEGRPTVLNPRPILGLDWLELAQMDLPAALVVTPIARGGLSTTCLFFPAESIAADPAIFARISERWTHDGWRKSAQRTVGQVTWSAFQPPPHRSNDRPRALLRTAHFFGVTDSDAFVQEVSRDTLATEPAYRRVVETMPLDPLATADSEVRFFMLPWKWLEHAPLAQGTRRERLLAPLARAERLRLTGVQALAGVLHFDPTDEADMELELQVLAPRPYAGALRLFDLQPCAAEKWPAWIDASTTSLRTWAWKFRPAMQGFGHLFDELTEPGPDGVGLYDDLLAGLRDDPSGPRVDLDGELFALMTSTALSMETPVDRQGRRHAAYVFGCQDTAKAAAILARFYAGDKQVTRKSVGRYQVWTVPPGSSLFVESVNESVPNFTAIALGEGRMVIATNAELLLKIAANGEPPSPLASSPSGRRAWSWLNQHEQVDTGLRWYAKPAKRQASAYKSAANAPQGEDDWPTQFWLWLLFGTTERERGLPYAAVPQFETWSGSIEHAYALGSLHQDLWRIRAAISGN